LDWQRGFRSWLKDQKAVYTHPSGPTSWCMSEWLGIPPSNCLELVAEFNASYDFGRLPPHIDAVEALSDLRASGHSIYVITSCGDDQQTYLRRSANLSMHFGDLISELIVVPLGVSKETHLAAFAPSIWVEDNYKNALMGVACGHH